MPRFPAGLTALSALIACAMPLHAAAQDAGSGSGSGGGDAASSSGDGSDAAPAKSKRSRSDRGRAKTKRTIVTPYIEAAQIVTADLSPGNEVLTYSVLAAGVDAEVVGVNNAASVSVRYEHRFGWGKAEDGDIISGIARGYAGIAPGLKIEAGGLATRSSVQGNGSSSLGSVRNDDSVTQIYSVYAGPSLSTYAGDVALNANYRIGYTRVDQPNRLTTTPGGAALDVFDESTVHVASVHAGISPYDVLPVGLGVGANYYREDISNLDQRVEDFRARADLTVPVTQSIALVGGIGYESVEISSRDALIDANGIPVVGRNGRLVTDKSAPRTLAYDVDGLIWDAGVMWRPSARTALEAHVGRRYGATTYYGTFAYAPTSRSSINVAVYDNVAGFGGQVNRALADLPTEFSAVRNPLSGNIGGCVSTVEGNGCLAGVLGSVRASTFRARGVMGTYALQLGRLTTGVGAGYDRRRFIAAPGTILAAANGKVDENYWLAAYLNGQIDARSSFATNLYANWFKSEFGGDASGIGATAAYYRNLTNRITGTIAVGIDGVNQDAPFNDSWTASALAGVRYSF